MFDDAASIFYVLSQRQSDSVMQSALLKHLSKRPIKFHLTSKPHTNTHSTLPTYSYIGIGNRKLAHFCFDLLSFSSNLRFFVNKNKNRNRIKQNETVRNEVKRFRYVTHTVTHPHKLCFIFTFNPLNCEANCRRYLSNVNKY